MSRSFRVYQKKRGNRRTGSGKLGSFGEVLFFGFFFLAGCIGLIVVIVALAIPEWRANHEFVETTCVVRAKQLGETQSDDGPRYRPEIEIEYEVNAAKHVAKTYDICGSYSDDRGDNRAVLDQFEIGKTYPCWYDPLDHDVAVLVRGYTWWLWLIFIVPASFLLLGSGGLLYCLMHWGKSAERQAAAARTAKPFEHFDPDGPGVGDFPNVPAGADMTNSPGTRLRFRLPISTSATWILIVVLVACGAWNGVVAVFMVTLIRDLLAGNPQWLPTLVMIPFLLVGIGLIVFFLRQLMITTGIGPTLLEISDHPLRPGETYRLFISQAGRLRINALAVLLVCEEHVQYRQGTDTRTETRCVHRQEIYDRKGFEIRRSEPLEVECDFTVPSDMMHSFKSGNNEVRWSLQVKGDVAGWPDYTRMFHVIVHPRPAERRSFA